MKLFGVFDYYSEGQGEQVYHVDAFIPHGECIEIVAVGPTGRKVLRRLEGGEMTKVHLQCSWKPLVFEEIALTGEEKRQRQDHE